MSGCGSTLDFEYMKAIIRYNQMDKKKVVYLNYHGDLLKLQEEVSMNGKRYIGYRCLSSIDPFNRWNLNKHFIGKWTTGTKVEFVRDGEKVLFAGLSSPRLEELTSDMTGMLEVWNLNIQRYEQTTERCAA